MTMLDLDKNEKIRFGATTVMSLRRTATIQNTALGTFDLTRTGTMQCSFESSVPGFPASISMQFGPVRSRYGNAGDSQRTQYPCPPWCASTGSSLHMSPRMHCSISICDTRIMTGGRNSATVKRVIVPGSCSSPEHRGLADCFEWLSRSVAYQPWDFQYSLEVRKLWHISHLQW